MEVYSTSQNTKDVVLTDFQKWVLFYFMKNQSETVTAETLLDNMCLTAVLDLDIDNAENSLKELAKMGLISEIIKTTGDVISLGGNKKVTMPGNDGGYKGTLKGRLYLKQKIIHPIVLAKREDKIKEVITYLTTSYTPADLLAVELQAILAEKDQDQMLQKFSDLALNQLVPVMNMLSKIQERFFGNT